MDQADVALLIFAAVTVGVFGQGWLEFLEHQQRKQAMEIIKTALQAGRDAPPEVYEILRRPPADMMRKPPWTEALVFGALAFGFLLAYFVMPSADTGEPRMPFLVIGLTMGVTSLGCVALALFRRDKR